MPFLLRGIHSPFSFSVFLAPFSLFARLISFFHFLTTVASSSSPHRAWTVPPSCKFSEPDAIKAAFHPPNGLPYDAGASSIHRDRSHPPRHHAIDTRGSASPMERPDAKIVARSAVGAPSLAWSQTTSIGLRTHPHSRRHPAHHAWYHQSMARVATDP